MDGACWVWFCVSIHQFRTWMSGSFESLRWNVCVHRLDLGLYSHLKEFGGNWVRTHVNSKVKIPFTGKNFRGGWNPWHCVKQDSEPNTLPMSYPGPHLYSSCFLPKEHAECISHADFFRQLHALPQWDRSCRSNLVSHNILTAGQPVPALTL